MTELDVILISYSLVFLAWAIFVIWAIFGGVRALQRIANVMERAVEGGMIPQKTAESSMWLTPDAPIQPEAEEVLIRDRQGKERPVRKYSDGRVSLTSVAGEKKVFASLAEANAYLGG